MHVCHQHCLQCCLRKKTPHCFLHTQREDFPYSGQLGLTLVNPWATWSPPAAQLTGIIPDNKGHGGHLCLCYSPLGFWHVCSRCWSCKFRWHGCFAEELYDPCSFGCTPFLFALNLKGSSEGNRQGWAEWREDHFLSLWNDLLKRDNPSSCKRRLLPW